MAGAFTFQVLAFSIHIAIFIEDNNNLSTLFLFAWSFCKNFSACFSVCTKGRRACGAPRKANWGGKIQGDNTDRSSSTVEWDEGIDFVNKFLADVQDLSPEGIDNSESIKELSPSGTSHWESPKRNGLTFPKYYSHNRRPTTSLWKTSGVFTLATAKPRTKQALLVILMKDWTLSTPGLNLAPFVQKPNVDCIRCYAYRHLKR